MDENKKNYPNIEELIKLLKKAPNIKERELINKALIKCQSY